MHKTTLCVLILCLAASGLSDIRQQKQQQASDDDPWTASEIVAPATLAAHLEKFDPQLHVVYVGSRKSYKGVHIPRALFGGPITKAKETELLAEAVKGIPHDAEITIYCGCRPFSLCPNIRPAYEILKAMGYAHIQALKLNTSFDRDWAEKGYPVEISSR